MSRLPLNLIVRRILGPGKRASCRELRSRSYNAPNRVPSENASCLELQLKAHDAQIQHWDRLGADDLPAVALVHCARRMLRRRRRQEHGAHAGGARGRDGMRRERARDAHAARLERHGQPPELRTLLRPPLQPHTSKQVPAIRHSYPEASAWALALLGVVRRDASQVVCHGCPLQGAVLALEPQEHAPRGERGQRGSSRRDGRRVLGRCHGRARTADQQARHWNLQPRRDRPVEGLDVALEAFAQQRPHSLLLFLLHRPDGEGRRAHPQALLHCGSIPSRLAGGTVDRGGAAAGAFGRWRQRRGVGRRHHRGRRGRRGRGENSRAAPQQPPQPIARCDSGRWLLRTDADNLWAQSVTQKTVTRKL
mmetsp:Transcript_34403/g.102196  ORF Transcript_34403/g.102196 Transcript_34403/m.102196 type:complete len:365 (-) Transcript_34403:353-1447(-)